MLKKLYTGLMLVAGVAVVSVVISRILGKDKNEDDGDECDCNDCCCK